MRTTTIVATSVVLLLAACGGTNKNNAADNPLVQVQHGEELADALANIIIQQDPIAEDEATRLLIEQEIARAKGLLASAQVRQRGGLSGPFLPMKENVAGWALYLNGMLYLSSDFHARPGIDLRLYITAAVDPRDVEFPDATAIDLGRIDMPYGPMTLSVPNNGQPAEALRTVVLWDAKLNRLHSFAQLSRRQ